MPTLDEVVANIPTFDQSQPSEDPAYLAFMRAQGYNEAQAKADVARRTGALDRELANQLPQFDDQERLGIKNVQGSAEANGVLNSGKTLVDAQQVSTDIGRQRNAFEAGISNQKDDMIAQLIRQIAAGRQAGAEQSLASRGTVTLASVI